MRGLFPKFSRVFGWYHKLQKPIFNRKPKTFFFVKKIWCYKRFRFQKICAFGFQNISGFQKKLRFWVLKFSGFKNFKFKKALRFKKISNGKKFLFFYLGYL